MGKLIKYACQQCEARTFIDSDTSEDERGCPECASTDLKEIPVGQTAEEKPAFGRNYTSPNINKVCVTCATEFIAHHGLAKYCEKCKALPKVPGHKQIIRKYKSAEKGTEKISNFEIPPPSAHSFTFGQKEDSYYSGRLGNRNALAYAN